MENLNKMFEKYLTGEVVTEEAKSEIAVVFEAAVNEKAEKLFEVARENLLSEYDEKFETVVEEHNQTVRNQLNDYLKHCATEFVSENKVAIQNSIVVDKARAILDGIQRVFEQHGIKLPEGNTEIVEEMNSRNAQLLSEYNEVVNENISMKKEVEESQKAIVFMKATSDLSEVSKNKLINLMSGLVVESVSDFEKKLNILIDNVLEAKKKKVTKEEEDEAKKDDEDVDDEVDNDDDDKKEDASVKEAKAKVNKYLNMVTDSRKF